MFLGIVSLIIFHNLLRSANYSDYSALQKNFYTRKVRNVYFSQNSQNFNTINISIKFRDIKMFSSRKTSSSA